MTQTHTTNGTIAEFLINKEIANREKRVADLKRICGPEIIIEAEEKIIAEIKAGTFKVTGTTELLAKPYNNHVVKKGRGGVVYLAFNDEEIYYWPSTRFGTRYIKMANAR